MKQQKEWIIGREGDLKVPDTYKTVSRRHARLTREADELYIEDLDSTAGTFVNGRQVRKKLIHACDKVMLGTDFTFDVDGFIQQLPLTDEAFTAAFCRLKDVYETCSRAKVRIQSQSQGKMMMRRSVPMALPGLLMVFISMFSGQEASGSRVVITVIGGVLTAAAMIGGSLWGAKEMEKMPERTFRLDQQFMLDYSCPSCRKPFGQAMSWEILRRLGECPHCKRRFNVKNDEG
jgi:DNA-directed RNA polymerase subunit RPC12/RpoP